MPLPFLVESPEKLYQHQSQNRIHNIMLFQNLCGYNNQNRKHHGKFLIPFWNSRRPCHTFPAHPAYIAVNRREKIGRSTSSIQGIDQKKYLLGDGISCDLRPDVGGRYQNKNQKTNQMNSQIGCNKPIKHVLSPSCRQHITTAQNGKARI